MTTYRTLYEKDVEIPEEIVNFIEELTIKFNIKKLGGFDNLLVVM